MTRGPVTRRPDPAVTGAMHHRYSGQCPAEHPNAVAIIARGESEPTRCNESRAHRGPHRTSFGRLF